jgi:predicted transcriptional regulator
MAAVDIGRGALLVAPNETIEVNYGDATVTDRAAITGNDVLVATVERIAAESLNGADREGICPISFAEVWQFKQRNL